MSGATSGAGHDPAESGRPAAPALPEGHPLPRPSAESEPFWEACAQGRLVLQRCEACGRFRFPVGAVCPECWSRQWSWQQTAGRGRVHSFVVYQRVYNRAFTDRVPYAVAVIELDEGPRMPTQLTGVDPGAVRVGDPVEVVFVPSADGSVRLPFFGPATE